MFFNLLLLDRQHRARFGIAWIAATRGIQYVPKKDVLDLNIVELCNEIKQYVCSKSQSPQARFSLRLSIILINGTLIIYKQKVNYVYEDLVKMLTGIVRPPTVRLVWDSDQTELFGTPPSPVARKKIHKRGPPVDKSTPQSELDKLVAIVQAEESEPMTVKRPVTLPEEEIILQARADEITLRETQLPREIPITEDFGALGTMPTEDELLQIMSGLDRDTVPVSLSLPPIPEEAEPLLEGITPLVPSEAPPRKPSPTSSDEADIGPIVLTVQAQVHAPADMETPPRRRQVEPELPAEEIPPPEITEEVRAAQTEMEMEIAAALPTPVPQVLREMQVEAVQERDKKTRRKKTDDGLAKLLISTKPSKAVRRINRCDLDQAEWIDINTCPLPDIKLKPPSLKTLLDMYMIRDERGLEKRQKLSEPSSLRDSLSLRRKSGRVTPPAELLAGEENVAQPALPERIEEQLVIPEIQVEAYTPQVPAAEEHVISETPQPVMASTPVKSQTPGVEPRTIEEVMPAAAEEKIRTPRKRRRLLDVEPELTKDLESVALASELRSRDLTAEPVSGLHQDAVDSVPLPTVTEQTRQQDIVHKVFVSGHVTLEEVCQRPVSKLSIARAFSDVLVLAKHNYVTLVSEENSLELKFIERGPKMNG